MTSSRLKQNSSPNIRRNQVAQHQKNVIAPAWKALAGVFSRFKLFHLVDYLKNDDEKFLDQLDEKIHEAGPVLQNTKSCFAQAHKSAPLMGNSGVYSNNCYNIHNIRQISLLPNLKKFLNGSRFGTNEDLTAASDGFFLGWNLFIIEHRKDNKCIFDLKNSLSLPGRELSPRPCISTIYILNVLKKGPFVHNYCVWLIRIQIMTPEFLNPSKFRPLEKNLRPIISNYFKIFIFTYYMMT